MVATFGSLGDGIRDGLPALRAHAKPLGNRGPLSLQNGNPPGHIVIQDFAAHEGRDDVREHISRWRCGSEHSGRPRHEPRHIAFWNGRPTAQIGATHHADHIAGIVWFVYDRSIEYFTGLVVLPTKKNIHSRKVHLYLFFFVPKKTSTL